MNLNCDFFGTELCCSCGFEFDFTFNPVKNKTIICSHCGTVQHPCSLCDGRNCGGDCSENIKEAITEYNKQFFD